MSRLNDHILSGGVELLDTESGRAEFFENLKKLDLSCDEETLKETLQDMQYLDETESHNSLAYALVNRLTQPEMPELTEDDSDDEEPTELMEFMNIVQTKEGLWETQTNKVYQPHFRELLIKFLRTNAILSLSTSTTNFGTASRVILTSLLRSSSSPSKIICLISPIISTL